MLKYLAAQIEQCVQELLWVKQQMLREAAIYDNSSLQYN